MRVAQVVESAGGGTGRHVIDLTGRLAKAGHKITLIYSSNRIEKNFLNGINNLNGIDKYVLPLRRSIGFHDIGHAVRLFDLLNKTGPFDIIHGHSTKAGALIRLLPRSLKSARIYSPHALRTMDPTLGFAKKAFFSAAERILAYRRCLFVAGSMHEFAALRSVGVTEERIELLKFGIDKPESRNSADIRLEFGLPLDVPVIGFVGRLGWQKAPERAIRALALLEDHSVHLAMVGEGELASSLRELAQREGLADRVHFLGFQNGQAIMPAFDLLIMPSRYESSPYVLLEAIMASVPVITTPVGMAEELISESGIGALVENADDPAVWAKTLTHQLQPGARELMSTALIKLQAERTLDGMVRQMEGIYDRAISEVS